MSSSTLRNFNSTTIPLLASQTFFGKYEFTGAMLSGILNCYASTNINVVVIQNPNGFDTTYDVIVSSTNIAPYTLKTIDFNLSLQYTKVIVTNLDAINQIQLDIKTLYTNLEYVSSIPTVVSGTVDIGNTVDISGNVEVTNVVDISGNVEVTSLINETLATRPVYLMSVGTWYRVATVGNTSGAVWNAIGAIVGGESSPAIGRLFKCLSVPGNIGGQGTVYDVEYTDTPVVSGSVSLETGNNVIGSVKIRDSNSDPIVTTAGNLMVGIGNIYTNNPLHTIVDSGSVSVSSLPAITGSVSASITTNPVITLDKPSYSIDIQNCNTTSQTIRGSAGCLSKLYLMHIGGSQFCYFKIYNASSASSSDTPLATFGVNKDTSIMIDTSSMNFSGGLCVRGTDNYGASDNTAPSGTLHLVAFLNGYYE